MKPVKYPLLLIAAATIALVANAVPARRGSRVFTQPDGTTITVHQVGDESCHFTLTDDNMLLTKDKNGQYSYAYLNERGELISTKIRALDSNVRPQSHANFLHNYGDIDFDALGAARFGAKASRKHRTKAYNSLGKETSYFPTKGNVKGLVILVQYIDRKFTDDFYTSSGGVQQYFTQMLNTEGFSKNDGTGSARDYFIDQSSGEFTPTFDVYGPVTLSKSYEYYGENDSISGLDAHAGEMIMEACLLADDMINYADYDCDGDGYVDNVFVFYAGTGEASSWLEVNTIWPHKDSLTGCNSYGETNVNVTVCDNVKIDGYACTNEILFGQPDGIGTFVHEFSHVLGLPDLYVTGSVEDHLGTPGEYSVMDYGSYNNDSHTPTGYGAYERNALGWIDLDEFNGSGTYELEHIATSNKAYVVGTSNEKEFFLFENRQLTGWDTYIINHGMLIWHIDASDQSYFDEDVPNNDSSHQCVLIVKANNVFRLDEGAYGWTWPGSTNNTSFTATTTPAFVDWQGVASETSLLNIAENDGVISFDVTMPIVDSAHDIAVGNDSGVQVAADNRTLTVVSDADRVEVYNVMGHHIASVCVSNGQAVVDMPTAGMYVVRAGNASTKVVVR